MMNKIGGIIEGLILVAIGIYAGLLVLYGDYWQYLNPKFKWLTGATAAMLVLVGSVAVFKPNERPRASRIIVFLILLRILSMGNSGIPGLQQSGSRQAVGSQAEETSRVNMDGREYTRINLGELYMLCKEQQQEKVTGGYAVRGIVERNEQLDSLGQFALLRNAVFCCLADSVGMGLRVQFDRLDELTGGEWVEVYGTLSTLPRKLPDPRLRVREMHLAVLSESHVLVPDKVIKIEEPEIPFMFEFREAEPYAF
jgi:uncharacterized repeat protein (TIGR03943 family)